MLRGGGDKAREQCTSFRNSECILVNKDTPSVKTRRFHCDMNKHNILTESGRCVGTRGAGRHPLFQSQIIKELGLP